MWSLFSFMLGTPCFNESTSVDSLFLATEGLSVHDIPIQVSGKYKRFLYR